MKILVKFFLIAGLFLTPISAFAQGGEDETEETLERYEFEQKVREFILNNPEVIGEALQILRERAETAQRETTRQAILDNKDLLENDPLSIVLGNPEGDVTLVEFYDYRCPYCRETHPIIARLLENDPGLRLVLKQLPVKDRPGETPVSLISARVAMVAHKKGVFEAFHNAMFEAEPPLTEEKVFQIARAVGLEPEDLKEEMVAPEITRHIRESLVLANEIGSSGTPTFVIGEFMVPGMLDYDILKQLVDYTRAEKDS